MALTFSVPAAKVRFHYPRGGNSWPIHPSTHTPTHTHTPRSHPHPALHQPPASPVAPRGACAWRPTGTGARQAGQRVVTRFAGAHHQVQVVCKPLDHRGTKSHSRYSCNQAGLVLSGPRGPQLDSLPMARGTYWRVQPLSGHWSEPVTETWFRSQSTTTRRSRILFRSSTPCCAAMTMLR